MLKKIKHLLSRPFESARLSPERADELNRQSHALAALVEGSANQQRLLNERLNELVAGSDNQSRLLNDRLAGLTEGLDNQSRLINERLTELTEGLSNQSRLLNDRLTELTEGLNNQSRLLNEGMSALVQGSANQSSLIDSRLRGLLEGSINQSRHLGGMLREIVEGVKNQSAILNDKLGAIIAIQADQSAAQRQPAAAEEAILAAAEGAMSAAKPATARAPHEGTIQDALQRMPLLLDRKTYNTSHPDYDAKVVRNYAGHIFNAQHPSSNAVFGAIKRMASQDVVPDQAWGGILREMLDEAKTVPHAAQLFERRQFIERYVAELGRKYHAHYAPGWVNLDDALFLYWLVRRLQPRTIVQTGVCNGLSAAFMMLALAKNGPNGRLHAIDLAPVFDPKQAAWTVKDKVYGVVIPEGRSSGWMVPDAYRDRFEVSNGDAKLLLPQLVERIGPIDMFYHDSDHTYDHMMFEFKQAKPKLASGGLIVADDISWNASVWDFADSYGVPSYNFKGSVGVAFF